MGRNVGDILVSIRAGRPLLTILWLRVSLQASHVRSLKGDPANTSSLTQDCSQILLHALPVSDWLSSTSVGLLCSLKFMKVFNCIPP